MADLALIIRDDANLQARTGELALARKSEALEAAALIGRVTTPAEQELAVAAQQQLYTLEKDIEEARNTLLTPLRKLTQSVNDTAKEFLADVRPESIRISTLIADFQSLEQARQRAASAAISAELTELERKRQEERAKCTNHEELDAVDEHFNQLAAELPTVAEAPTVKGQVVKDDWDIKSIDVHKLYRFHPNAVELKPLKSVIKELLDNGMTVQGVAAERVVRAQVRRPRAGKVIEA